MYLPKVWKFILSVLGIGLVIGIVIWAVLYFEYSSDILPDSDGCMHRDYGNGGTVCVCNEKYCDKIQPIEKVNSTSYIIYTSSKAGFRFHKQIKLFESANITEVEDDCDTEIINCSVIKEVNSRKVNETGIRKILIDKEKVYQTILGWGGSFTDSTGININSLSGNLQDKLLRSYFSEDGLEYNLGRIPIGGCDFSTHAYSYLDTPEYNVDECSVDPELTKFKLAEEDYKYKLPLIRVAVKLAKELKLVASPWSSPKWMKENSQYVGMLGYLKKDMYQTWVNYLIKFLDTYKEENVTFWGITPQNEPFFAMGQFENNGILYTPEEMRDFIRNNLGPTIRNSSYSYLHILAIDDVRAVLSHSADTIFSVEENLNYIDGVALHWYFGHEGNAYLLEEFHNKYPDKYILYTEACIGFLSRDVLLGAWDRGEEYARDIIELPLIRVALKLAKELRLLASPCSSPKWMKENSQYVGMLGYHKKNMYQTWVNYLIKFLDTYTEENVTFWGITPQNEPFFAMGQFENNGMLYTPEEMDLNYWVTGWIDWNMVLDLRGGPNYVGLNADAPIIANANSGEFYKQPTYYVLGHFSKFVPSGSVRIYSSQCKSDVQVVAFKRPDSGVAIIITNRSNDIRKRSIQDPTRGKIDLELGPHSISTILYW